MQLGAFSVSLPVGDLGASQQFYEHLGFEQAGGNPDDNWVIMRNGDVVIGLFHGMFDTPILTFNPGLDQQAQPLESFADVRDIQAHLKSAGIALAVEADPADDGPAHVVFADPDGNQIMIDQFVARPGSSS